MKKAMIALLMAVSFSGLAGIPVIDVASIAKTIEEGLNRAQEAAANLTQLKKEAEEQKARLEGFTDFKSGFDSASSYMKDSLSSITDNAKSDLSGLRSKYELSNQDNATQERYDGLLQQIKFYDDFNSSMRTRADRITQLQQSFARATTPQKKADLANQLSTEQMTLDMQIKQYDIAERQMEAKEKARQEKINAQFTKQILQ